MSDIYAIQFTPADLKKSVSFYIDLTDGRSFDEVIYPDSPAPILRNNLDGPELGFSIWGMPSPDKAVKHINDKGITHIRQSDVAHWQKWQTVAHRCLIPAIAFCKQTHKSAALSGNDARWLPLHTRPETYYSLPAYGQNELEPETHKRVRKVIVRLIFLTTKASSIRDQDTPISLPVILTNTDELDGWMTAPWDTARLLHRPLNEQKLIYL